MDNKNLEKETPVETNFDINGIIEHIGKPGLTFFFSTLGGAYFQGWWGLLSGGAYFSKPKF